MACIGNVDCWNCPIFIESTKWKSVVRMWFFSVYSHTGDNKSTQSRELNLSWWQDNTRVSALFFFFLPLGLCVDERKISMNYGGTRKLLARISLASLNFKQFFETFIYIILHLAILDNFSFSVTLILFKKNFVAGWKLGKRCDNCGRWNSIITIHACFAFYFRQTVANDAVLVLGRSR